MFGMRPSSTSVDGYRPWIRTFPEFKNQFSLPQYFKKYGGYQSSMGSRIHYGSNERQKGDQEFDHVGVRSGVGIKPKTNLVTTPFGNHHLVDWGVFPHEDEDKQDYENLAEDPKFKKVVEEHLLFLLQVNRPPASGSGVGS